MNPMPNAITRPETFNRDLKRMFADRLRQVLQQQPEFRDLQKLLLRLGGVHVAVRPEFDPDLPALLTRGFVMSGTVLRRRMEPSGCHLNVAIQWMAKRHKIIGIGTGYGLSDDGIWRQHSWGILRDGLLETTEPRIKYFGILLQGAAADSFAFPYASGRRY
jgi:hypothetical protein